MGSETVMQTYTPVGDIIALIFCLLNFFLLWSTYTIKQKKLQMFTWTNGAIIIAVNVSFFYHILLDNEARWNTSVMLFFRDLKFIALIFVFCIFECYIANHVKMENSLYRKFRVAIWTGFGIFIVVQLVLGGLEINPFADVPEIINSLNLYHIVYLVYAIVALGLLIKYKRRFVTKSWICLIEVLILAFGIALLQVFFHQESFTCVSFVLPLTACLFLFHYNAYDVDTGTLDYKSLRGYINEFKNRKFAIICLTFRELTEKAKKDLSDEFYHFNEKYFKGATTFKINEKGLMVVFSIDKNTKYMDKVNVIKQDFEKLYVIHQISYKIVFLESDERMQSSDDYLSFISLVNRRKDWNTWHFCDESDIKNFIRFNIIQNELKDIDAKQDLEDERVLVYCQPVLNTHTGKFNTAEALMRLEIPSEGMFFPDEFIPIAEQNGYIHTLSRIILNKTCNMIKQFSEDGYQIDRISVNFSMSELRIKSFCDDVIDIINNSGVSPDKVAIELTESRNEQDFDLTKTIISTLHKYGIKFYLDDFGTGYSNFERIIGLPIDIIKFDRSLTIMAGKNEVSKYMVGSFCDIFKNAKYQVLFEGVEDENDEKRCIDMNALYLQGYKYSKPVPIENLKQFLIKSDL